jgi:hypothetical protein
MTDKENHNPDDMSPIIAKLCASCQDASTNSLKILSSLKKQKKIRKSDVAYMMLRSDFRRQRSLVTLIWMLRSLLRSS